MICGVACAATRYQSGRYRARGERDVEWSGGKIHERFKISRGRRDSFDPNAYRLRR